MVAGLTVTQVLNRSGGSNPSTGTKLYFMIIYRKDNKFIVNNFLKPVGKVFNGKFLNNHDDAIAKQQYQENSAQLMKQQMLISKISEENISEDVKAEYQKEFIKSLSKKEKRITVKPKQEKFRVIGYEDNKTIVEFAYENSKKLKKYGFVDSE